MKTKDLFSAIAVVVFVVLVLLCVNKTAIAEVSRKRPQSVREIQEGVCAGQDASQGVPYTADCLNAVVEFYGCQPGKYSGDTSDVYYNTAKKSLREVFKDRLDWAFNTDAKYRQSCYGSM